MIKILKVKKRGWLARELSIDWWEVTILDEDGVEKAYNCWGDRGKPSASNVLFSLREKIKAAMKDKESEKILFRAGEADIMSLEGKEIEKIT
ncbi:MAG TPA: hypothetical protein ENI04_01220 [Candidatus Wildermuthbacteria bacterium]|nr:hypothetical protein [Candidatus Wildermuthbacteria bacterium]